MGRAVRAGATVLVFAVLGCSVEGDLGGGVAPPPCATKCDGACVDFSTNPQHCGACNVACAEGEECRTGVCSYPWPARWIPSYVERFTTSPPVGWQGNSGICARQGPGDAPDGTRAWLFRPDWAQLRRRDLTPGDGYRAWVWRMWIEPPTDRAWNVTGCIRTRVTPENGTDGTGMCFELRDSLVGYVRWVADGSLVVVSPSDPTPRWVEFRWEIGPTHRRARARIDGALVWEGAIDDTDWDDRPWSSLNVWRSGYYAGCNTGLFLMSEVREEVAATQ
jgi:Stigma-specific protein, Stig1